MRYLVTVREWTTRDLVVDMEGFEFTDTDDMIDKISLLDVEVTAVEGTEQADVDIIRLEVLKDGANEGGKDGEEQTDSKA